MNLIWSNRLNAYKPLFNVQPLPTYTRADFRNKHSKPSSLFQYKRFVIWFTISRAKICVQYLHITLEMLSFIYNVKASNFKSELTHWKKKVYLHRPDLKMLQNLMNNCLKTSLAIFDFLEGISKPYFRHLPAQSTSRLMCFTMLCQFQYMEVYLI